MKKILIAIFALLVIIMPTNIYANTNYDIINLNADTYNYTPTPVISGEEFEIWIQLTNRSNVAAENIEYLIVAEYPFVLISENEGKINKLEPFQSKIIKYKIKADSGALTGTYDLEFRFKRDGINVYNIKKYIIDVKGKNAIVDIIASNIEETNIGSDSQINLVLKNLGQKDAKDIFITVNDSQDNTINVIGLKTQYLEKINIDEEKEIVFKINFSKNIENTSHSIPITIDYSDVDREYTITRQVGIRIYDQPNLLLNVLDIGNNFKIKPNSSETISVEIYNTGNVDSEIVYLTVSGEGIYQTQDFIGSIEKDNYDKVDFTLNTKDIKEKETEVTVDLIYKDNNLKEQKITQTFTVKTDFTTNGENANKLIMSILGIIGFIVGLAIFILIARWLIKILIKPAYKVIINIFKKK
jgi:hypothetical protein